MGIEASTAKSDEQEHVHIAVVDFDRIWREAKAAVYVRDELEKIRESYQKEVIKFEGELRTKEESLRKKQETLSSEKYEKLRADFENEVKQVQKEVQARKQKLEHVFQVSMDAIRDNLTQAVKEVAEREKYEIVLSESQIAYHTKKYNITEQVLETLNKRLPTIKLDL